MTAPDKIYTDGRCTYTTLPVFSQNNANECYIRKDSLIEWVAKELEIANETDFDDFGRGEVVALERIKHYVESF